MLDYEKETEIAPPSSPLTVKINMTFLDLIFDSWAKKYLPAYEVVKTSGYRTKEKNAEVGGAANSAHVHGLAYDFVLKQGGKLITGEKFKSIYKEFIEPNWPGFALFEGDHVHVNLSRKITVYAGLIGLSAIGAIVAKVFYKGRE